MLVSRTLAKGAIARGERPSWVMAWGPVLVDIAAITGFLALLFKPVLRFIYITEPPQVVTFLILFVVFFVPFQAVIILSSLWASRSRWVDDPAQKESQ